MDNDDAYLSTDDDTASISDVGRTVKRRRSISFVNIRDEQIQVSKTFNEQSNSS